MPVCLIPGATVTVVSVERRPSISACSAIGVSGTRPSRANAPSDPVNGLPPTKLRRIRPPARRTYFAFTNAPATGAPARSTTWPVACASSNRPIRVSRSLPPSTVMLPMDGAKLVERVVTSPGPGGRSSILNVPRLALAVCETKLSGCRTRTGDDGRQKSARREIRHGAGHNGRRDEFDPQPGSAVWRPPPTGRAEVPCRDGHDTDPACRQLEGSFRVRHRRLRRLSRFLVADACVRHGLLGGRRDDDAGHLSSDAIHLRVGETPRAPSPAVRRRSGSFAGRVVGQPAVPGFSRYAE